MPTSGEQLRSNRTEDDASDGIRGFQVAVAVRVCALVAGQHDTDKERTAAAPRFVVVQGHLVTGCGLEEFAWSIKGILGVYKGQLGSIRGQFWVC